MRSFCHNATSGPSLLSRVFIAKPAQGWDSKQEATSEPDAAEEDVAPALSPRRTEALAEEPASPSKSCQARAKAESRVGALWPFGCCHVKEVVRHPSEVTEKLSECLETIRSLQSQVQESSATVTEASLESARSQARLRDLEALESRHQEEALELEALQARVAEARNDVLILQEASQKREAECVHLEQLRAAARRLSEGRSALQARELECQRAKAACGDLRRAEDELLKEEALLQQAAAGTEAGAWKVEEKLRRLREHEVSRQRYWELGPPLEADKLCHRLEELRSYRDRARAMKRLLALHQAKERARQVAAVYLAESLAASFLCQTATPSPQYTEVSAKDLAQHVALVRRLQTKKCDVESRCDRERRTRAALQRRLVAPEESVVSDGSPSRGSPARSDMRRLARTCSRHRAAQLSASQ